MTNPTGFGDPVSPCSATMKYTFVILSEMFTHSCFIAAVRPTTDVFSDPDLVIRGIKTDGYNLSVHLSLSTVFLHHYHTGQSAGQLYWRRIADVCQLQT